MKYVYVVEDANGILKVSADLMELRLWALREGGYAVFSMLEDAESESWESPRGFAGFRVSRREQVTVTIL